MFYRLTDSHLERVVFFGTLSWSQDKVVLQYDSTTETCRLRVLQDGLRPTGWSPVTGNNETLHPRLTVDDHLLWPVMRASQCVCSYLPGTLRRSAAKPFVVVLLVAGLSVTPLTHTAHLTTGESDWDKKMRWLLLLLGLFLKFIVIRMSLMSLILLFIKEENFRNVPLCCRNVRSGRLHLSRLKDVSMSD